MDGVVDLFFNFLCAGNTLTLSGLIPNTSYIFNVRARNAVGAGNSVSVSATTSPPRECISCACSWQFFHITVFS